MLRFFIKHVSIQIICFKISQNKSHQPFKQLCTTFQWNTHFGCMYDKTVHCLFPYLTGPGTVIT